ncbi:class I SAM-dependent methyltransferase, partial [Streptomyces anulatus]
AVTGTDIRLLARDLTAPGWADEIGPAPWDAAVSSTALHWLTPDELTVLYRTLAGRLRPGGVFVDADNRRPTDGRELNDIAHHVRARRALRTGRQGSEAWAGWWKAFLSAPELAPLAEARARSPIAHRTFREPNGLTTADQIALLREAGFSGAATVWQCGDDSVLVAVR